MWTCNDRLAPGGGTLDLESVDTETDVFRCTLGKLIHVLKVTHHSHSASHRLLKVACLLLRGKTRNLSFHFALQRSYDLQFGREQVVKGGSKCIAERPLACRFLQTLEDTVHAQRCRFVKLGNFFSVAPLCVAAKP